MEEKLKDILREFGDDVAEYEGDNYFDEGLLDSIQVVELVWKLEKAFNIKIKAEKIVEENFCSKKAIISLISGLSN